MVSQGREYLRRHETIRQSKDSLGIFVRVPYLLDLSDQMVEEEIYGRVLPEAALNRRAVDNVYKLTNCFYCFLLLRY